MFYVLYHFQKHSVIVELSFIANLLASWYSSEQLIDPKIIENLCHLFKLFWPWTKTTSELEIKFLNCLFHLSNNCLPVCRGIIGSTSGSSDTLLKSITIIVHDESTKEKNPKLSTDVLEIALQVLSNCCVCIEARLQLANKLNILDNFNRLQPYIAKNVKGWSSITYCWLQFWKIFSKYPEGGMLKHINLLCALVLSKQIPEIRILALEIIKNMCSHATNRPGILTSESLMQVFQEILDSSNDLEQKIVVTAIWKLIANNAKAKTTIKSTVIPSVLNKILKTMSSDDNFEENELYNLIVIVSGILNDKFI